jgi:hypothetical protein
MALLKIAVNVIEGKEPVGDLVSKIESEIGIGATVIESAVEAFVDQFDTIFGAAALGGNAVTAYLLQQMNRPWGE